jgi:hypothetical protein
LNLISALLMMIKVMKLDDKPKLLNMAILTACERLHYANEKNVLIQGLPSSIEKQFIKLSFAKNVTPLLKNRKIDFALIFSVSHQQLLGILNEVMPHLQAEAKLWIAYPKPTAKISSDLCRDANWPLIELFQLEAAEQVELDNVWCATQFLYGDALENTATRAEAALAI